MKLGSAAFGRLLAALAQAVILVLVARQSTVGDFGAYSIALAAGTVVSAILGFGWVPWLLRLPAERKEHLRGSVVSLALTGSMTTAALVVIGGSALLPSNTSQVLAAAAIVFTDGVALIAQNNLFSRSRIIQATVVLLVNRLTVLIAVVVSYILFEDLVFQALIVGAAVSLLASALSIGPRSVSLQHIGEARRGGIQYWKVTTWSMLQQLDVPLIGTFVGQASAGAYAAAFRLASPVHIVTSSLNSIYVPLLGAIPNREDKRKKGLGLLKLGAIYSSLVIILSPTATFLGPFLLGAEYSQYSWLFCILLINSGISVMNQLQIARLYASGEAQFVAKASMFATSTGLLFIVSTLIATQNIYLAACGTILIQIVLAIRLFGKGSKIL